MTTPASQGQSWTTAVARYQTPDTRRAVIQLINSFLPFFGAWILMFLSLEVSYWLTLLLAFPAAGFLVRIFIIQHDCGHGSFLSSTRAMDVIGFICGVLTWTPYKHWRRSHSIHHASSANLAKRGTGDIETLTINEYLQRSRWQRLVYRLYRHPLILFGILPFFNFMIVQRIWFGKAARKEWASMHWTNLALAAVSGVLILTIGLKAFLLVEVPLMVVASSIGTWLFYVQHQFEDTYWVGASQWDYSLAALKGSSYYALPAPLRWFTGNIGFHHIHHLSPRIPNYKLRQCHEENPDLQQATALTLWSSFRTATLSLWDEDQQRLVGFSALDTIRPDRRVMARTT